MDHLCSGRRLGIEPSAAVFACASRGMNGAWGEQLRSPEKHPRALRATAEFEHQDGAYSMLFRMVPSGNEGHHHRK